MIGSIESPSMSEAQRMAAKWRSDRESQTRCPACNGSGRVVSGSVSARARMGGTASYLRSLKAGQLSMADRGKRGGRPRERTLADVKTGSEHAGTVFSGANSLRLHGPCVLTPSFQGLGESTHRARTVIMHSPFDSPIPRAKTVLNFKGFPSYGVRRGLGNSRILLLRLCHVR